MGNRIITSALVFFSFQLCIGCQVNTKESPKDRKLSQKKSKGTTTHKSKDKKTIVPSPKQLEQAKEAYAKYNAQYRYSKNDYGKELHIFIFPSYTKDEDLEGTPDLPFAFGLNLFRTKITNNGLSHLSRLKNLYLLDLPPNLPSMISNPQITDDGLIHLKDLINLRRLSLYDNELISEKGITHLKRLRHLNYLRTNINDKILNVLKSNGQLHALHRAKYKGPLRPSGLDSVLHFDLSYTPITSESFRYISELKNLHSLNLDSTQVSDEWLKHLKDLERLKYLDLSRTKITDAGLAHLKDLENLYSLNLEKSKIQGDGLKYLKNMKNLKYLTFYSRDITDSLLISVIDNNLLHALRHQSWYPLLKDSSLNLAYTKVSDEGMATIAEKLPSLYSLTLPHQITDKGLSHLKKLKNLSYLYLRECKMTKMGIMDFQQSNPKCRIAHQKR